MTACTGSRPFNLGVENGRLAACPASPNCVSSDAAADASHFIEPYRLQVEPAEVWLQLTSIVKAMPRTSMIFVNDDYLHAESKSLIFRFVDDLEFHLRPAEFQIAVRSASRLGYSDLGANRRRVEQVRETLQAQGLIK
ncbi:MAG: DUF1499 domain-containing protein [Candidatus Competibacteraceae bacterium]|nr:DUF1499 domain-containing protein [Candidatus Competibacteraceae bacterium]